MFVGRKNVMTVWSFLKSRMQTYGNRIAFRQGNLTYAQLISLAEGERGGGKLRVVRGRTKQETAVELLRCLACGDVAVPLDGSYGEDYVRAIRAKIENDRSRYPKLALLMFTSGTTGTPKGVMLSHKAIVHNLKGIEGYFEVATGQRILIFRSLVHISAITGELLYALYRGLEIDFYEEAFSPQRLANRMAENGTEIFCCTPTLLYHIYRYLDGAPLDSIAISGERISNELVALLKRYEHKIKFYNVYGLTENAPRVSSLNPDEFFAYAGSVGKPIRNTRIKLKNGELLVKSASMMSGYYMRKDLTAEKLKGGWLHTGDMAELKEKRLYINGRKDGMLIRGGINLFPEDIERAINAITGVDDCIVYGKDDVAYGQKIYLDYAGGISEAALRRELAKRLPPSHIPNHINKTQTIPLTASGKKKRK